MKAIIPILLLAFGFVHSHSQNQIHTVTGAIPVGEVETVLIHEHILVDFIGANQTGYHRWDRKQVIEKVLPYLEEAKENGVNTFFDCTPAYLGRDPLLLKELSEKSGIQIVTNTGFYGAVQDKYVPAIAYQIDADSMANTWIKEFEEGIEGTGIRPGFIKIAVDTDSILSDIDKKIVRAAIKTHLATGLTIVSHTGPDAPAFAQLKLLENEGVSPSAWVWTHAQGGSSEGRIKAAEKGAWISLDYITEDNIQESIVKIEELKSEGLLNRVLISHDAGWYEPDKPGGGDFRGYTAIFTHLIPALKENGFSQNDIDQLLIKNPQEVFGVKVRGAGG